MAADGRSIVRKSLVFIIFVVALSRWMDRGTANAHAFRNTKDHAREAGKKAAFARSS
jgi:hypothetical protein